jgi:hypothetical protein
MNPGVLLPFIAWAERNLRLFVFIQLYFYGFIPGLERGKGEKVFRVMRMDKYGFEFLLLYICREILREEDLN